MAAQGFRSFASVLRRLRPQFVNLPIDMVRALGTGRSRWIARILRALGFSLLYWTTNETEQIRFAARYADIIVTDDVGQALQVLGSPA